MKINDFLSAQADRKFLEEKPFLVMARVAIQLGRESISDSITAIIELIKNAYDADAEEVKIRFSGLSALAENSSGDVVKDLPPTILVIEDFGNGMTKSQLEENWLVIGTPNKLKTTKSSKGRVLTGEKGLGRLGLDRLGQTTILRTFTQDKPFGTELIINWQEYEDVDQILEKVNHKLFQIPKKIVDPITGQDIEIIKGTQLIVYGLKDPWSKDNLKDLKRELTLLVSPFAGINDFKIELNSGLGDENIDGDIGSDYMLEAAEWSIIAEITPKNKLVYRMHSKKHEKTYETGEIDWGEKFKKAKNKTPQCGPVIFRMYFFPRKDIETDDLSLSKGQIDEFLNSNQGIRIYRDIFRVKPYGEPDGTGDWLTLSFRRQQSPQGVAQKPLGGWRVGYNQVVGAVFITRDDNPNLIDQTNRESIVEGTAFSDLKMFAIDAVSYFEYKRQEFEMNKKKETEYEQAKERATNTSKESTNLAENLGRITQKIKRQRKKGVEISDKDVDALLNVASEVKKKVVEAEKAQKNLAQAAEIRQSELQIQKDTLGNLASLGILAKCFGHETLGASNVVAATSIDLRNDLIRGLFMVTPDIRQGVEESLDSLIYSSRKIETFAKFTLKNVRRDKRSRKNIPLNEVITQVFDYFNNSLVEKNIDVQLYLQEGIPDISAFRIDWESIIVNFITNSIWALEDKPANERVIRVTTSETNGIIRMSFADSGIGIEEGTTDRIFLPTFSTRRNDSGEIDGTGMGLTIVKGFVEAYPGGKIEVLSPSELGGAQFNLTVYSIKITEEKIDESGNNMVN